MASLAKPMPRASLTSQLSEINFSFLISKDVVNTGCSIGGLGVAVLVWKTFLPWAERKSENDEEDASKNKNASR